MKKIKLILLPILLLFVCACSKVDSRSNIIADNIDTSKYDTSKYSYVTCTRDTTTTNGEDVVIKYEAYYDKNKYLQVLKSYEKVISSDSSILKQYKDAYTTIYQAYKNLDYYDNEIDTNSNSVTSITYINYGKIDMDKLMEIEGTTDNVKVNNGKIKLSDWKSFAKKYGTVCKN